MALQDLHLLSRERCLECAILLLFTLDFDILRTQQGSEYYKLAALGHGGQYSSLSLSLSLCQVLILPAVVGKSALIVQFVQNLYVDEFNPTVEGTQFPFYFIFRILSFYYV